MILPPSSRRSVKSLVFLLLTSLPLAMGGMRSSDDEVYKELFTDYCPMTRPLHHSNERIIINITVGLTTIIGLSSKLQQLETSAFAIFSWSDPRLTWNLTQDRPTHLVVEPSKIWTPELLVLNSMNTVKYDVTSAMNPVVSNAGVVVMEIASVFRTRCSVDIRRFPVDEQTCPLVFAIGNFQFNNVTFGEAKLVMAVHEGDSGDWVVQEVEIESHLEVIGERVQSLVELELTLKRQPLFHILTILVPVVCLSCLNPFVFLLPVKHGERASFSVSILLSFTVILSELSYILPSTTVHVCYVGVFSSICMLISGVINLLVIITGRMAGWKGICPRTSKWTTLYQFLNRKPRSSSVSPHEHPPTDPISKLELIDDNGIIAVRSKASQTLQYKNDNTKANETKSGTTTRQAWPMTEDLNWHDLAVWVNWLAFLSTSLATLSAMIVLIVLMVIPSSDSGHHDEE